MQKTVKLDTVTVNEINYSNGVYPKVLRYIREYNRVCQKDLAVMMGIDAMDVMNYEHARVPMPKELYDKAYWILRELEEEA